MRSFGMFTALVVIVSAAPAANAEIVLENRRARVVLGDDARWRSLIDKASQADYCAREARCALAVVKVGGKTCPADRAAMRDGKLVVGFTGCDTKLIYAVKPEPDWILFRLAGVAGTRPSRVTLVQLAVTITRHVGSRLNCAWDDNCAVCLMAANLQARGRGQRRAAWAELTATTQDAPGPKLEGAAAALVAAPTAELDAVLHRLSLASGLPRNRKGDTASKRLPIARQSYWFLSFSANDVEKVIDCCRQTGLRQVMLSSGAWCRTVGHYTFHTSRYPGGIESLRRTVAKLHRAGILVGMHCYASKVSKTDAYVAPVPDRRFWVDRTADLAGGVGPNDKTIRTKSDLSQWPGSPAGRQKLWEGGVAKHQEVVIDDEIIRYAAVGPEGGWDTFLDCRRGSWGTKPAAHKAGAACRHYGVDGCINGYIVDQETTLLEETTSRLAGIFNTCGFDMVYFDGGEDVDRRRFHHYVSKFQAAAMGKFRKRPLVHMGTIMTHRLWHSFTRSGTVDTYLNTLRGRIIAGGTVDTWPTVKDHVDRSVQYMLTVADDRMPGELGWFGIWPKGQNTDGLQLDEIEYLMAKSLAYDAPISLQTSFSRMQRHPLTPGILEIVRAYEELRMSGKVPEAVRRRLRQPQKDFVLLRRKEGGQTELVEVAPVEQVAGGREVRAFVGRTRDGAVATAWHYLGKPGKLLLAGGVRGARVLDVFGKPIPHAGSPRGVEIPLGPRRATVILPGTSREAARKLLAEGAVKAHPAAGGPPE